MTTTEGWESSCYEIADASHSIHALEGSEVILGPFSITGAIEKACAHPAAKVNSAELLFRPSDLALGLLHRLLWGSRFIFPLSISYSKQIQKEEYVAKRPLWSKRSRSLDGSILLRLATFAERLPVDLAPRSPSLCSTVDSNDNEPQAHRYQLSGSLCEKEIELLRDLILLSGDHPDVRLSLQAVLDQICQRVAVAPTEKQAVVFLPSGAQLDLEKSPNPWIEDAVKRGLFSETFYRRTNPDLPHDTDMRNHFTQYGWREGRDPSQYFSTTRYLSTYSDVSAAGMNPLEHYCRYGDDRSTFPSTIFDLERGSHPEAVDLALVNPPKNFSLEKHKIAVLLHIHYPEFLHDILPHLESSRFDYDLLITATSQSIATEVHAIVSEYSLRGHARVRVVPNRGRDIGAFINEFTDVYCDYDLICKLHGKKSPHLDHFGSSWRRYLIAHVIGDDNIVRRIAFFFSISRRLGVFAPVPFKGTNNTDWAENLATAKELVAAIDPEAADRLGESPLYYPSATVFWFRPESLKDLYRRYPVDCLPCEPLPVDGTVAHALERLIPFFTSRSGYLFGCYRHRKSYLEWSAEYPIFVFLERDRPSDRRKVLLFSHDASNTGAPRTAIGLHRALNARGDVDCLAVVLGGGPLEERFHEAGPSLILPNGICLDVLANILEVASRDVTVICNTVVTGEVVELARNYGIHVVSLVHEYASTGFWPKILFRKALEADVSVFPGRSVLESAVSFCEIIPAHNCLLRPQGLYRDDFPRFTRAEVRASVIAELSLDPEAIIIMGCGMLEHRKGFDIFLDTAQCMLSEEIDSQVNSESRRDLRSVPPPPRKLAFIWVGDIPPSEGQNAKKHLERIETCPELSECVHILGQMPEADRYFAAADIFFLSSRFDPFPGVVLEAMAAGLPVVCFQEATDVTDAFIPLCGGYALDRINPADAASVLGKLVLNQSLRLQMGDFSRRRVHSHYSFASYVNTLIPHLFVHDDSVIKGRQVQSHCADHPDFSIVVPAYRTPLAFLQQLMHSVLNQSYRNFELIIAASELEPLVADLLMANAVYDSRVKPVFLERNMGIANNTNAGLSKIAGTHVCFLDHDDLLPAHCLRRISEVIARIDPDFLFTDEDKVDVTGSHFHSPVRKPGFSQQLLERNNYITHFTVVKREILDAVGGMRADYDGAQDYDFILRATDASRSIWHIPEVLYHWRETMNSTSSGQANAKPYAVEAGRRALEDHLHRLGRTNEIVISSDQPFVYLIRNAKDS